MLVTLCVGLVPAHADGCYPPPCLGREGTFAGTAVDVNTGVISSSVEQGQSTALPFAAAGLLMVMTTLATVCLRRRAVIRASAMTPARAGATALLPSGSKAGSRTFEGSIG